jgi:hypothetical protein
MALTTRIICPGCGGNPEWASIFCTACAAIWADMNRRPQQFPRTMPEAIEELQGRWALGMLRYTDQGGPT